MVKPTKQSSDDRRAAASSGDEPSGARRRPAGHSPVLLGEVLSLLSPKSGESYLDLTAGFGGHASAVLARTLNPGRAVLIDRDGDAVAALRQTFAGQPVRISREDYLTASRRLSSAGERFDLILADLGVSSFQLDCPARGFSLKTAGRLDMRMDQRQALTAERIVNSYAERELIRLLRDYGEESRAARVARAIVAKRPLKTTAQLAAAVAGVWSGQRSKLHPATRTFQALRIAVNSELDQLERALPIWLDLLAPGGRLTVISFHSLEDRLVKRALSELSGQRFDAELKLLTKRPVTPTNTEIAINPRSRSAKLRAAVKIKTDSPELSAGQEGEG
jgi:16S rRNA (cytosine1402-N4)-methyltransferase